MKLNPENEETKWELIKYLNDATERSLGAFGGMGAEPGSVTPDGLAVAAGDHLTASDHQFEGPHGRQHLPKNKAAGVLDSCAYGLHSLARRNLCFAANHLEASRGVHVLGGLLLFETSGGSQVLLYNVMSHGGFLRIYIMRKSVYCIVFNLGRERERTYKRGIVGEVGSIRRGMEVKRSGREGNGSEWASEDAEQELQVIGKGGGGGWGGGGERGREVVAVDLEPVAEEFPVGSGGVFLVGFLVLELRVGPGPFHQRSQRLMRVPNLLSPRFR